VTIETRYGSPNARAYVSLGANLGDRARTLGLARARLFGRSGVRLVASSAVVETAPVDVLEQPDFLNQVVAIETALGPRRILEACLEIERDLGRDRTRGPRGGPRTIDLDLLLYDGLVIDEPGLEVPHPRLAARTFFLELLDEVGAPESWLPDCRSDISRL
jgi:2-amino-4-hydroxy-6-hydroxymethyldihydropteridine diphosphokinase